MDLLSGINLEIDMGSKAVFLKEDIIWAFETFIGQLKSSEAIHPQTIRVVERLKSQIVEIVPTHEVSSPWHTGTPPMKKGTYLIRQDCLYAPHIVCERKKDGESLFIEGSNQVMEDGILAWQKIEPYREKE